MALGQLPFQGSVEDLPLSGGYQRTAPFVDICGPSRGHLCRKTAFLAEYSPLTLVRPYTPPGDRRRAVSYTRSGRNDGLDGQLHMYQIGLPDDPDERRVDQDERR
jgi:hypothetical protein